MRIASLDPALTDIVLSLGLESSLVAATEQCQLPESLVDLHVFKTDSKQVTHGLALSDLALSDLVDCGAGIILARADGAADLPALNAYLQPLINTDAQLRVYQAFSFDSTLQVIIDVARDLKCAAEGQQLANRLKAQAMDWGANFYSRTHNKKVTVVASLNPLMLYGLWVPDLVSLASAHAQCNDSKRLFIPVEWNEIVRYRPDVILFAPSTGDLKEALSYFKMVERFPNWEDIPAVKRGEVIFSGGRGVFDRPSLALRSALAIVFSAIAGFDSGYITDRDTFHRLRWVELQRQKF